MNKYKTACAIIVNENNEILLTKRAREPFKGYWALPSGIGESKKGIAPEVGIVEEVRCDLGTESFIGKLLFTIPIYNDNYTDEAFAFEGRINEAEINLDPVFSQGYKWFSTKDKKAFENLAFEHTAILQKYFKNKETV